MKFRWKMTLWMLCLVSLLFGVGGSALINISFRNALDREKESTYSAYRMLLGTLQVVNGIDVWEDHTAIPAILEQLLDDNSFSWASLRLSAPDDILYEKGSVAELPTASGTEESHSPITGFSTADDGHYLQISGSFTVGDVPISLTAAHDVTSVYVTRNQQISAYRKIYIGTVLVCALLAYSISRLLTRPLEKLSAASKEIAVGNLAYRSSIQSNDEIGALSAEFDSMAHRMEENVGELRDAVQRQERFVGSFTHELKTPMSSIIGYADLLRGRTLDQEEQAEAANYIFQEGRRLENLSIKLLELFVANKDRVDFRRVSCSALIDGVLESFRPQFSDKRIVVRYQGDGGEWPMDPDLMWSLVANLVDNAIKAVGSGGRIDITSRITGDSCQIVIRDNGKGIPDDALEHITEAFYRANKSRSRTDGGAGLGLALCQKIVELHGGSLHFESAVGKGTEVVVELGGGTP